MSTNPSLRERLQWSLADFAIRWLERLFAAVHSQLAHLRWLRLRHRLFKPRPGDIYIVTAPKAGTTWAQQIVHQLLTEGRGEFDHVYQVAPYLDVLGERREAGRFLEALPSPRVLKTHLNHEHLLPPADSRILYVTRDASDSLLSYFHHRCLREGFHLDFDAFFRGMLARNPWSDHLKSWWPHRSDPNVLHVRYEDLIADLEGGIRRIAAFLGIPIQEERMPDILHKCGFAYMKQHNTRFDIRLGFYDSTGPGGGFIRKGVVGAGRAALSPEQQAALGAVVDRLRGKLGIRAAEL
ncbi:sulfotransferase domain-containing protein [Myxococcus sp. RHSTA-1-4]|uniref:sulfotransferase domain-containing protein n=1 Tax=Myxococcus sp. RHSTA-1-4 TaxID=2874601 RepID=UPI001CBD039A|nr:sulfotransferase domain-containing protein [Myxococcus sp. RHSTA-1-4]MBZ4418891.1 sulfotransferase domain-containing protein [Myxococcus sp. RHSTA-1-4]